MNFSLPDFKTEEKREREAKLNEEKEEWLDWDEARREFADR